MLNITRFILTGAVAALTVTSAMAQGAFAGFQNKGLVGVGRIPADSFDKRGYGTDTLGGIFSAMYFKSEHPFRYKTNGSSGTSYNGFLYAQPDRGFGDGTQDFQPRYHIMRISVTPNETATAAVPAASQDQVKLNLLYTDRYEYERRGRYFTGFDADPSFSLFPRSYPGGVVQQFLGVDVTSPASLGSGRRSMDAEGIVAAKDGTIWVSDEYGPLIYHFGSTGMLIETITPGNNFLPKEGSFATGKLDFAASDLSISSITGRPDNGRNDNRGLEGLTITPDGKRLVAILQSPLMQDSGSGGTQRNTAINTRILFIDIEPGSVTYGRVTGEYVYQIAVAAGSTITGTDPVTGAPIVTPEVRHMPISEIIAINATKFLVIERDGYGRGQTEIPRDTAVPVYKKVRVLDIAGATNLAGGAYSLEKGATGAAALPFNTLPVDNPATTTINEAVVPCTAADLINLLDTAELAKFNLNVNSHMASDANSLSEKWEGLSILPMNDPANPDDYLLLIGNDNDFKASTVYHNGTVVGMNPMSVDNMILAYRVTLPGYQEAQ
jgi:hypothetical protein